MLPALLNCSRSRGRRGAGQRKFSRYLGAIEFYFIFIISRQHTLTRIFKNYWDLAYATSVLVNVLCAVENNMYPAIVE